MKKSMRDRLSVASWAARTTYRRASNRVFDALGVAAGLCMADTWQPMRRTYAPGYAHWRCYLRADDHASGWHRSNNYKWIEGQPPIYDPQPVAHLDEARRGAAPRWLRGRHFMVGTRRRDRQRQAHTFEQYAARRQAYGDAAAARVDKVRADADEVLMAALRDAVAESPDSEATVGELGVVPFTAPPVETHEEWIRSLQRGRVLRHAFQPGPKGSHLEIYCQAQPEPGAGPVLGYNAPRCGWPEGRHPEADQAQKNTDEDVAAAVADILGDEKSTAEAVPVTRRWRDPMTGDMVIRPGMAVPPNDESTEEQA